MDDFGRRCCAARVRDMSSRTSRRSRCA